MSEEKLRSERELRLINRRATVPDLLRTIAERIRGMAIANLLPYDLSDPFVMVSYEIDAVADHIEAEIVTGQQIAEGDD